MDIVLFCFGALGALLTVYIGKQEIVPEFRPLFDTSEKEKEAIRHHNHIKLTEQHIDTIQARIEDPSTSDNDATKLQIVLETSLKELQAARERLQILEHEIKQSQVISRALGFLFYIVLGGIFGSLLAGQVKIEGLNFDIFFSSARIALASSMEQLLFSPTISSIATLTVSSGKFLRLPSRSFAVR